MKAKELLLLIAVLMLLIALFILSSVVLGFAVAFIIRLFKPDFYLTFWQLFLLGLSVSIIAGVFTARSYNEHKRND